MLRTMDWDFETPVETVQKQILPRRKGMTTARTALMPARLPALIRTMAARFPYSSVSCVAGPPRGYRRGAWPDS